MLRSSGPDLLSASSLHFVTATSCCSRGVPQARLIEIRATRNIIMTVGSWPEAFAAEQIAVTGGTQYVRLGGKGPAVLLLHGFGDTGDMWVPLAEALVKDHAVIVPDLRGMGLSSHPEGGYEKVAQARDLATILDQLGFQEIALVTHDIGNMVGYAFAALFPQRVSRWVVM